MRKIPLKRKGAIHPTEGILQAERKGNRRRKALVKKGISAWREGGTKNPIGNRTREKKERRVRLWGRMINRE